MKVVEESVLLTSVARLETSGILGVMWSGVGAGRCCSGQVERSVGLQKDETRRPRGGAGCVESVLPRRHEDKRRLDAAITARWGSDLWQTSTQTAGYCLWKAKINLDILPQRRPHLLTIGQAARRELHSRRATLLPKHRIYTIELKRDWRSPDDPPS